MAQHSPETADAAVQAEQIRTLYRQSLAIIAVNPLNAAIVVAVLWPWTEHPRLLLGWVAAMLVVFFVRASLRRAYLHAQPSIDEHDVWGTIGVSENIIEASWLALVDAVEYKLCKDEAKI